MLQRFGFYSNLCRLSVFYYILSILTLWLQKNNLIMSIFVLTKYYILMKKITLLFTFLIAFGYSTYAQVSAYSFSTNTLRLQHIGMFCACVNHPFSVFGKSRFLNLLLQCSIILLNPNELCSPPCYLYYYTMVKIDFLLHIEVSSMVI